MGFFGRSAASSTKRDQPFLDVIQNNGDNTGRGLIAWRDPRTDFNTRSKLLVRKGEEAIFENGASEWAVFPSGTECSLHTQNIAFIRALREAFSGGETYFPCRVYFVSTEEFEIEWGTTDPIGYTCPIIGPGAQLRGGGVYVLKVSDSALFAVKCLRDNSSYTTSMLKVKLFERIYQDIADVVSRVLEETRTNCMEVSKRKKQISNDCKPGIQELLSPYGLTLVDCTISLEVDEAQRQLYEEKVRAASLESMGKAASIGTQVNALHQMGEAYMRIRGMDTLENMASNPGAGGVAAAGAGLGMGMAAGSAFADIASNVFGRVTQPVQAPTSQFGGESRFGAPNSSVPPTGAAGGFGQTASSAPVQEDPVAVLSKLKRLLDADLITQAEYDAKKREIMSRM